MKVKNKSTNQTKTFGPIWVIKFCQIFDEIQNLHFIVTNNNDW